MKKLPLILNKRAINKTRSTKDINIAKIKPVTYYKYEEVPSNISKIFFNDYSISQSTFYTNKKNKNCSYIPIDHKYYSTINFTKKFPLSRNLSSISIIKNHSHLNKKHSSNSKKVSTLKDKTKDVNKKIVIEEFKKKKGVVNMDIMEHHMRKLKEKMKRTKFKLFKIIINNEQGQCMVFESKNIHFNDRLKGYLNSQSFYKKNKNFHKTFHFSKNDLNLCNDFKKHYIEPRNRKKNIKLTSKLVLKSLTDEDKNLIYSDPYFFLKDDQYLYKLTNTKFKSLLYRLKEEEKNKLNQKRNETSSSEDKKDNINIKDKSKSDKKKEKEKEKENIKLKKIVIRPKKLEKSKTIENSLSFYDKKYIDKLVNEDLNQRLKSKKKINEIEKEMINTITKLNTYKKKDYIFESNNNYFKSYNEKTNEKFFKPYFLKKNNERLIKEQLFYKQRNTQRKDDNVEQGIILKYQKMLEDVYRGGKE